MPHSSKNSITSCNDFLLLPRYFRFLWKNFRQRKIYPKLDFREKIKFLRNTCLRSELSSNPWKFWHLSIDESIFSVEVTDLLNFWNRWDIAKNNNFCRKFNLFHEMHLFFFPVLHDVRQKIRTAENFRSFSQHYVHTTLSWRFSSIISS